MKVQIQTPDFVERGTLDRRSVEPRGDECGHASGFPKHTSSRLIDGHQGAPVPHRLESALIDPDVLSFIGDIPIHVELPAGLKTVVSWGEKSITKQVEEL